MDATIVRLQSAAGNPFARRRRLDRRGAGLQHVPSPKGIPLSLASTSVEHVDLRALSSAHVAAWRAVETRAADGNAFGSASWVLPAAKHLRPNARGVLALVWAPVPGGRQCIAAMALERRAPSPHVPLPHWRPFWTEHSYQSGALVDAAALRAGTEALAGWLSDSRRRAIDLPHAVYASETERAMSAALAARGWRWHAVARRERAALEPGAVDLAKLGSSNQRKKARRAERALGAFGDVSFDIAWPNGGEREGIDTFIRLEADGWKGDAGSAISGSRARLAFAREMLGDFAERGALYVSSLRAGDEVVATSVNMVSGDIGYGFKIGWAQRYAACSPGTLHEVHYVRAAPSSLGHLRCVDATADEGSFVDRIWPHRRTVVSGVWTRGVVAGAAHAGVDAARALSRLSRG